MIEERREFSRVHTKIRVTMESQAVVEGHSEDVSMNGVLVACNGEGLTVGSPCELHLYLNEPEAPIELRASGIVRRADAARVAVEFTSIDFESYEHLRALVVFNSHDPDRVMDELGNHLGIRRNSTLP